MNKNVKNGRERDVLDEDSDPEPGNGGEDSDSSEGSPPLDPPNNFHLGRDRVRHPAGGAGFMSEQGLSLPLVGGGGQSVRLDSIYHGYPPHIKGYDNRAVIEPIPSRIVQGEDGRPAVEYQNPAFQMSPDDDEFKNFDYPGDLSKQPADKEQDKEEKDEKNGEDVVAPAVENIPAVIFSSRRFPGEVIEGMHGHAAPRPDNPIRQLMTTALRSFMVLLKKKYQNRDYVRYENVMNLLISMRRGVGVEAKTAQVVGYLEGDEEIMRLYRSALPQVFIENASRAQLQEIGQIAKKFSEEKGVPLAGGCAAAAAAAEPEEEEEEVAGAVGYANPFAHIPDTEPPVEKPDEPEDPRDSSRDKPEQGRRRRPSRKQ